MNKYNVVIRETLVKMIEIEANSEEEAEEIVDDMYYKEEIVLDADDFNNDTEIYCLGKVEDYE